MTKTRSFLCQDKPERFLINSPFSDRKGDAGALRGGERPLEGVAEDTALQINKCWYESDGSPSFHSGDDVGPGLQPGGAFPPLLPINFT